MILVAKTELIKEMLNDDYYGKRLENCKNLTELYDLMVEFIRDRKGQYKRYGYFYYCRTCGKWIPKVLAQRKKNKIRCPFCNKQLRTKSRYKPKKVEDYE